MTDVSSNDARAPFTESIAYERYIGRWSRLVARDFITWLGLPARAAWFDVACGTGALTSEILSAADPVRVDASDPASARIAFARRTIVDARATFSVGDATRIAAPAASYDAVVAALAFPAIADTAGALAEFARLTKPGGTVAAYVWDFDGEMQVLRYFWEAASEFEADAEDDDPSAYAICSPAGLRGSWQAAGFSGIAARAIDARADFADFNDYWSPFLTGSLPGQQFVQSLDRERRTLLRERLRATLPRRADGSISLIARAWAVKGTK